MLVKQVFSFCIACVLATAASVRAANGASAGIEFTEQEKAYIERTGVIKMCVDPDWVPFERINEQGRHEGIAADLVQFVARQVGLRIELHPVKSWDESLVASKAKQCQIMSFLNQSPARDQWLIFTEPIFFDPNIIVTREEHAYIGDLRGVQNESVALPRGTMVEERIRRDYPNLKVVLTNSEPEAIALVSERKVDMTIRSLIVAAYAIKKEGLFNLKIAGQIPELTNKLRIGVLKDEPILRDILDKGVGKLTAQDREAISNKHVSISVQHGSDYALLWKSLAAAALLLLVVAYWNRKLSVLNKELERLSVTDKLTGLYNRMKLDEALDVEIQRARRYGQPFSVILLDVDHFKRVNDSHGHQAGDRVLIEIARLLRANTREIDIVGRWGGEEFMILCPQTDQDGAQRLAENLRRQLAESSLGPSGRQTASFGVSSYQAEDQTKDLVARADMALYAAKRNGRDRIEMA